MEGKLKGVPWCFELVWTKILQLEIRSQSDGKARQDSTAAHLLDVHT
jgi:hypothetical protein